MKIVLIDDCIGSWFVDENYITKQLTDLEAGEDIEVRISSPGGEIYTGIAIFNKLRELARTHSITVRITALCASMAAYIALAPRTLNSQAKVIVSENSIYMIHNPSTYTFGDYREMRKQSDMLDKLSSMFASTFAFITKKTEKEIRKLMDEETWYFGNDIVEGGFANLFEAINTNEGDSVLQVESAEVRKIKAQSEIMSAQEKYRTHYQKDDLEKAVALIGIPNFKAGVESAHPSPHTAVLGSSFPALPGEETLFLQQAKGKEQEQKMTPEELKIKFPDCYNAIMALGAKEALEKERERVIAHLDAGKAAGSIEIADKYIRDGSSMLTEKVQSDYLAANMKNARINARVQDNPPDISSGSSADDNADEKALLAAFNNGFNGRDVQGGKA